MTSRTTDIHCENCRKYLFSLQPLDFKGLEKDYYCKDKKCKQEASIAKLKGKDVVIKD
jgi:hypothetical protein